MKVENRVTLRGLLDYEHVHVYYNTLTDRSQGELLKGTCC